MNRRSLLHSLLLTLCLSIPLFVRFEGNREEFFRALREGLQWIHETPR